MSESKRAVMHPLLIIEEWRKGCTCTFNFKTGEKGNPSECQECTVEAMKAIEDWFEQNPQWKPSVQHAEDQSQEDDELLNPALIFVLSEGHVSIAALQRKFNIGYSRAARIVDQLENEGLISPPDDNGKRDVR